MSATISQDRVRHIWEACCRIYALYGRRLALPAGTDPVKTYQWRYATRLAQQVDEWGLDEPTTNRFIEIAVEYAKSKGLMAKGLALVCQSNLLQICYKRLQADLERARDAHAALARSSEWVQQRVGTGDPVAALTQRSRPGAYCNLVKWHQERRINDLYLALSKTAGRALKRLADRHPAERALLPSANTLYLLREEFLVDHGNQRAARAILAGDYKQCR